MKYATENLNGSRIFFNFMATNVPLSIVLKMEALEANTYVERLRKMTKSLAREVARLELLQQVKQETSFELNEQQREFFLQQEIRNIKRELGTDEGGDVAVIPRVAELHDIDLPGRAHHHEAVNEIALVTLHPHHTGKTQQLVEFQFGFLGF